MATEYNQELADRVCELLMDGYSLRKIQAEDGMPTRGTVLKWLRENESFRGQYAQAREEQADTFIDDMHAIADDSTMDVNHRRLQIDTRKWTAAKLKPKKYGDSTQIKHADADGNKLSVSNVLGAISGSTAGLPRADESAE